MTSKKIIGVIFDFDGVIIDSTNVMKLAFDYAYNKFYPNKKAPFVEFIKHLGQGFSTIINKMGLPLGMYEYFNEKSIELIPEIDIYDGIEEIISGLQQKNVYLGIATGKDKIRTHLILKHKNLLHYFDTVVCSDEVARGKPYTDSIDIHIDRSGLTKNQLLFIGDSISDIQCAHNAGIFSIAVLWGQGRRNDLFNEKPDYFAYEVDDLKYILLNKHFL